MTETLKYSVDQDGIALLVIDIPGRPMNVLTPEFMGELGEAIESLAGDAAVKGVVITSAKDSFIAGADLKDLVGVFASMQDPKEIYGYARSFTLLFRTLETCGKPLVAAINGTALGGGLELCLACHHRVALNNPKAKIGLPEVQVGLLPGAGGTQRLPRMIGTEKALMLMVEGTHLDPVKAHETGIVEELAATPEEMIAKARTWILEKGDPVQPWDKKGFKFPGGPGASRPATAQTFMVGTALVAQKTMHNYPAPIAILSCVYEGSIVPIDKGLEIESQYFVELLSGPVSRNMIRTLFLDKGAADKLVRRPKGVEKAPVKKLGVLGAGMMGAGIAYVSAFAGMEVVLLDTDQANAEKGKGYSKSLLDKRVGARQDGAGAGGADPRADPAHHPLRRPRGLRPGDRGRVRGPRDQAQGDRGHRGGDPGERDLRLQHLDAADHRARRGLEAAGAVHRHPLLLARGQDAAGGNHRRQGDRRDRDRARAGLRAADQEDPHRGERQPRLLHQPGVRHLRQGRRGDARRGRQARADRERGEDGRDAGRAAGGLRRGHAGSFLQDHEADPQGSRRGLPRAPGGRGDRQVPRRAQAARQALRRRLLRVSRGRQEAPLAGPRGGLSAGRASSRMSRR
jgi:enoyl-CoA hydratase/carnithine racemase